MGSILPRDGVANTPVRYYPAMPALFLAAPATAAADLTLVLVVTAAAGAVVASLLRLPSIVGYLIAGAIAGPALLDLVADPDRTRFAADLGVALLLFVLGVELSLRELYANLFRATAIGVVQIASVGVFAGVGAYLLGASAEGAFVVGSAISLSSTAAGLVLLNRAGETGREIAPLAAGILIVQDLVAIVLIAVIPSVTGSGTVDLGSVALHIGGGLVAIAVLVPLVGFAISMLLRVVAIRVDRELFLIIVVAAIGLIAAGTAQVGLSVALGAFVAGLVISQSGFASQALREVEGFATIFAAIFFVSAGLLVDPAALTDEPGFLPVLLFAAAPLKAAVLLLLARLFGLAWKPALALAIILGNAGEFSFVVAEVAEAGVVGDAARASVVSVVTISLVLSSVVISRLLGREPAPHEATSATEVAIIGYTRLGRSVAFELRRRGLSVLVIESEADLARLARTDGFEAIWGDARRRSVASRACKGRVVFVTPRGESGQELVTLLAEAIPGGRVVTATAAPADLAHLGLDLTVIDIDQTAARMAADAVSAAVTRPAEPFTVRAPGGTMRLSPHPLGSPQSRLSGLISRFLQPPVTDPARCPACHGTRRRQVGLHFVDCSVCQGTGRRTASGTPSHST